MEVGTTDESKMRMETDSEVTDKDGYCMSCM